MTDSQTWDARGYATNARFVADLAGGVVDLLDPRPGEHILDLGCGDGVLTEQIASRGATVTGADNSPDLVAAARTRGIAVDLVDGQALTYNRQFDAVFTNAALHWMPGTDAVLQGVAGALKPRGRFVGEFGGHGNVAAIVTALLAVLERRGIDGRHLHPWYFPTPDAFAERLGAHGFTVDSIGLIPRPTPLPTGLKGWLETFSAPFLTPLPASQRAAVLDDVATLLRPSLRDDQGQWTADYVRLRFAAHLSGV